MNAHWTIRDIPSLRGKIALVTGANRGLGFEMASALAGAGAAVVLGCRDLTKGRAACEQISRHVPRADLTATQIDLADLASIRSFAEEFRNRHTALDILCHNAGSIMVPSYQTTKDGFELQLGTNYIGAFALTGLLLAPLKSAANARVVNNSSMAHRMTKGIDLADVNGERKTYKVMDAYGRSKLASLLFTFELARRLSKAGSKIISVAAHPGIANTNPGAGNLVMRLVGRLLAQSPSMGALPALYAAAAAGVCNGDYFGPSGFNQLRGYPRKVDCSDAAKDGELAVKLWELSERLTGVAYDLPPASPNVVQVS